MQRFLRRLESHGSRVAVVNRDGSKVRYDELLRQSQLAASRLAAHHPKIQPGDRVALVAEPSSSYVAVQLAAWRLGAITVPLCPEHPPAEQAYIVKDSACSLCVAPESYAQAERLSLPLVSQEVLLARAAAAPPAPAREQPHPDATLIYTSGSTGRPKGVVTSFAALEAMVDGMVAAWRWTPQDAILHFLPLHHVHGAFNMLLTPLAVGARVDFCAFEPLAVWERLCGGGGAGEAPTVFMGVPTAYSKLLECFDPARHSGARRLRLFVCGSAPLPAPLFERFEAATTHRILERWGMTEVGMGLSNPYEPASRRLPGFVGLPMPGVQARLELDDGGPPPAGEPGNLLVRGPQVFSRYWGRDPEQTRREEFREGGWFRTGDVALYDPALDSYKIVGRASVDIIKVAGYKVSAVDVERELLLHPAVLEVAVLGLSDAVYGEQVAAVVGLRPGQPAPSSDELAAWLRERLAHYKVPRKVLFVPHIPRNTMHKVNKKELRRLFE